MASSVIKVNTIQIRDISIPMTVEANSTYNTNLINKINADLPSGYRCLGICGYATNHDSLVPVNVSYNTGGDYSFMVKNISAVQRNVNGHVQYLCQPT